MAVLRAVFDCNTLLQAISSPEGPAGRCVQLAVEAKVYLVTSVYVLEELQEVARRPRVIAKLWLNEDRVQEFFEAIEIAATLFDTVAETFVLERDPDDAHYIDLAVASAADVIVSRDRDLLDLMDSSKPGSVEFKQRFPALRILDPVKFLFEVIS